MVIEYVKILHTQQSLVGITGRCISETNPPYYVAGEVDEIKKTGELFCCADMRSSCRAGHIGFGSEPKNTFHNKIAEVFVRVGKDNGVVITHCPWCGEHILTKEIASL